MKPTTEKRESGLNSVTVDQTASTETEKIYHTQFKAYSVDIAFSNTTTHSYIAQCCIDICWLTHELSAFSSEFTCLICRAANDNKCGILAVCNIA